MVSVSGKRIYLLLNRNEYHLLAARFASNKPGQICYQDLLVNRKVRRYLITDFSRIFWFPVSMVPINGYLHFDRGLVF